MRNKARIAKTTKQIRNRHPKLRVRPQNGALKHLETVQPLMAANLGGRTVGPHRPPCSRSVGGFRPPPGAQVSAEQALAVQSALLRFGRNASLLVFGLGNDAPMWHKMTGGRVAFIEDSPDWVKRAVAAAPYLEAHVARYTQGTLGTAKATFRAKGGVWPQLDLQDQLPRSVQAHRWDVVVVDAPQAGARTNPGRQQSIYTAAALARPGGVIFVDDCERDNEAFFAATFLGAVEGSVRRAECRGLDHRSGREKLIAANRRCEYRAPGAKGTSAWRLSPFGRTSLAGVAPYGRAALEATSVTTARVLAARARYSIPDPPS
jgi:hypothetical protein